MKEINKLAKRGWWKAMIHQRTLSLILTLDDFLLSGPHILFDEKQREVLSDPNVFFVKGRVSRSDVKSELDKVENQNSMASAHTYYIMRPFIRGILFGLNPFYQISLFVPCNDQKKINLYKEIISKIDIGGQFFQDRIYWSMESLQRDIMDDKLACLIYADKASFSKNDWIKKISIESKPFVATIENYLEINNNLSDIVEMRSFLEEMHQRYFSIVTECQSTHFVNMIRLYISECDQVKSKENVFKPNGFYSVNYGLENHHHMKNTFISDRYSLKDKETKAKTGFKIFKNPDNTTELSNDSSVKLLIEEYEEIIQEQLDINSQMCRADINNGLFTKLLCRWNMVTLRKSDILRNLLNQQERRAINEKLNSVNATYFQRRYQDGSPESDIFRSSQSHSSNRSETSDSSCYIVVSDDHGTLGKEKHDLRNTLFTTWYVKLEKT